MQTLNRHFANARLGSRTEMSTSISVSNDISFVLYLKLISMLSRTIIVRVVSQHSKVKIHVLGLY
jgi:hypothetical protein